MTLIRLKIFSLIFTFCLLLSTIIATILIVAIAPFATENIAMFVMCSIMSMILSFLVYSDYTEYKQVKGNV